MPKNTCAIRAFWPTLSWARPSCSRWWVLYLRKFYLAAAPFHLNSAQLGSIFFVYLLGVVITPQSGWFMDRFGFRHTTILYCSMMIAGLLLTLVKTLPWLSLA